MLIQTAALLWMAATLSTPPPQAGAYHPARARRHFVSVYLDRQWIQANHFEMHPLEELLGQEVNEVHLESFQYRTHDNLTLVNVREFGRQGTAIGAIVYPFGSSEGATLAIKGSLESLPTLRLAFSGPAPFAAYELTNGRALDIGAGIDMSDRSPGWGLGSHAFVIGGVGRAITDQLNGSRYFAEGGGGVMFGPLGVDIAFKYTVTRFTTPTDHTLHMIPVTLRASVSF
jgi:hypothetical protein